MQSPQPPPQFGRQRMQLLANGEALVHSTSEVIRACKGESTEVFLRRLARECGVGPLDSVEVTYKGGMPDYAVIERA